MKEDKKERTKIANEDSNLGLFQSIYILSNFHIQLSSTLQGFFFEARLGITGI
jgi:hypothetical protein